MDFEIIIPTYNNLEELKNCLSCLESLKYNGKFRVWVCIDGSTDGTEEYLKITPTSLDVRVLFHTDHKNHGRAATRNLALGKMSYPYLLLLDSDMLAQESLLTNHKLVLDNSEGVSIGGIHYENKEENIWVKYLSGRGVGKYNQSENVPAHYFITPNSAMRRDYFEEIRGFDPLINRYGGEDMDLGIRLKQKFNLKFINNPKAECNSFQPKGIRQALNELSEYGRSGVPYLINKHPDQDIYLIDDIKKKSIKGWLMRMTLSIPLDSLLIPPLAVLPNKLREQIINVLVIQAVWKGYKKNRASKID